MTTMGYGYQKKWRHERNQGLRRTADANDARLHIATCLGAGMSLRAIAGAAGVSVQSVSRISQDQARAKHDTIAAILAVQPGITTQASRGVTEPFVPKVGAVRRIQALIAIGWPHTEQSKRAGLLTANIGSQPGRWITASTHRAIAEMYDELSMTPGPSALSRSKAARLGYAPPLAWDDIDHDEAPVLDVDTDAADDVDDVAVQRAVSGDKTVTLSSAELRLAITRLHANGITDRPMAERLGCSDRTVLRIRAELGLPAVQEIAS